MKSISVLQEGLLTDDQAVVGSFLDELDLRTSNEAMVAAGEEFQFKTVKVFERVYGLMAEISEKLGYSDSSPVGKLLKKWQIHAPNVGTFGSNGRKSIEKELGIEKNDGRSLLIDFNGFLIAAVKGEGQNSDEVLGYLLKKEREARVGGALVGQIKAEEHAAKMEHHKLKIIEKKLQLVAASKAEMPQSLRDDFLEVTGATLPEDRQQKMFSKN